MITLNRDAEMMDADAAWEYAYSYYHHRQGAKDAVVMGLCIVSLIFGIAMTIYLLSHQCPTESYLIFSGQSTIAYVFSFIMLILHVRIDRRARNFACYVTSSEIYCKPDIRVLYQDWLA